MFYVSWHLSPVQGCPVGYTLSSYTGTDREAADILGAGLPLWVAEDNSDSQGIPVKAAKGGLMRLGIEEEDIEVGGWMALEAS
jgi:hypothetical protein